MRENTVYSIADSCTPRYHKKIGTVLRVRYAKRITEMHRCESMHMVYSK